MKHRTPTLAFILLLSALALFVHAGLTSTAAGRNTIGPEPQRRRVQQRRRRPPPAARRPRVDYSSFSHRTPAHIQACDSCHTNPTPNWSRVRAGDAAFPDVTDYPEHRSCMNCHKQQFFVGARPVICSVCHTNASPRDGTRHPFRNPEEDFGAAKKPKTDSEFAINFPHDRHQDVMARLRPPTGEMREFAFVRAAFARQEKPKTVDSCSICHQTAQPQVGEKDSEFILPAPENLPDNDLRIKAYWMKKGTLKTTPTSHASCFNCHWQEGGESPLSSNCAGCHKLLPQGAKAALKPARADADLAHPSAKGISDKDVLASWARRKTATFRHQEGSHSALGCTSCHVNITAVNKLDANTLDVPIQTCSSSSCHGATRAPKNIIFKEIEQRKKPEGANYQCIKCHLVYGKEPTPKSHLDLFPAPKPK
ncbi:MAG: hypothetical protein LC802_16250 [Acidobacteria bacterium]|nr:hypothetical protein [Acidobacteriota bacterium]